MGERKQAEPADDRIERLIAAQEVTANAINRLVQVLERAERKKSIRAPKVRPAVKRPRGTVSPEDDARAGAVARAALARLGIKE
jgi:hypothetical protein